MAWNPFNGENVRRLIAENNVPNPIRVGLMVPENNTTMAHETLAWLPPGSRVDTIRIPRGKQILTSETLPAYRTLAVSLASEFVRDDIDVVIYGCTAAGFISGPSGDASLAAELTEVTSKPVVTAARSMVVALQSCAKARAIALVTPYPETVNRQLTLFLDEVGISVARVSTMDLKDTAALGRVEAHEVAALARRAMAAGPEVDALFIACSQLPTATILGGLEQEFGRPAWSSIRASAWLALASVKID